MEEQENELDSHCKSQSELTLSCLLCVCVGGGGQVGGGRSVGEVLLVFLTRKRFCVKKKKRLLTFLVKTSHIHESNAQHTHPFTDVQ